ncbi:bifunctional hydroxymethylpyrimidine kinase/phosphomethylpyrimidine kinase [Kocuria tytonis]|uniref:Bifunctional hydroxymethylpyrimidine kinase/phosphomethylpyrimidine kinase n=1 Tax=Kocuria tytonis TaxID=2054280 RepID=A0A495A903_9MICC|nr:bifunctional hydroxymethylpyrimidine kinase/phosphomethylpyrimidine kinase [Kocuria tytonis]RKQ36526.1 bifunctional hydroxymethylpyrimidine kinase/phosphomethylpyrimidine kinase [Kocuria tytonis]
MTATPSAPAPRVLSIAGTDPTGGAGHAADLKSVAAMGGYGLSVITAVVAQNTQGVVAVHTPPVTVLRAQLDAVAEDVELDAVKVGMLGSVDVIETVGRWLAAGRAPVVVIDPVMVATAGGRLLDPDAEDALRGILHHADLITPNLPELAVLAERPVATTWDEALEQGRAVAETFGTRVLVKGGHLCGDSTPDALVVPGHPEPVAQYSGDRVPTRNTHGTGCSLSSAVATVVARTGDWAEGIGTARSWLRGALRAADSLHVGHGNGPVHHMHHVQDLVADPAFVAAACAEPDDAARAAGAPGPAGPASGTPRDGAAPAAAPAAASGSPEPGADGHGGAGERFTDELWRDCREIRERIAELPFVTGLGDGTLERDAFEWYLDQDMQYLDAYSRALALLAAAAPEDTTREFFATAAAAVVTGESALHRARLGERDPEPPSGTTGAYVDFLLARTGQDGFAVGAAAVLPCYWLYAHVGSELTARARAAGLQGHPFADWLETYDDPEFRAATETVRDVVDRAAARADSATRDAMRRAFLRACRLELEFFAQTAHDAAHEPGAAPGGHAGGTP